MLHYLLVSFSSYSAHVGIFSQLLRCILKSSLWRYLDKHQPQLICVLTILFPITHQLEMICCAFYVMLCTVHLLQAGISELDVFKHWMKLFKTPKPYLTKVSDVQAARECSFYWYLCNCVLGLRKLKELLTYFETTRPEWVNCLPTRGRQSQGWTWVRSVGFCQEPHQTWSVSSLQICLSAAQVSGEGYLVLILDLPVLNFLQPTTSTGWSRISTEPHWREYYIERLLCCPTVYKLTFNRL